MLQTLPQRASKFAEGGLVSPVPPPLPQFLRLDQSRFCENRHVMGDRRLGEVNPRFNIRGAKAYVLADGTGSALFEGLQDSASSGIGDGVQHAIQGLLGVGHSR